MNKPLNKLPIEPRASAVKALDGTRLLISFVNQEERIFDMSYLFDLPVYRKFKDPQVFANVYVKHGIVHWDEMTDLAPETAYYASVAIEGGEP